MIQLSATRDVVLMGLLLFAVADTRLQRPLYAEEPAAGQKTAQAQPAPQQQQDLTRLHELNAQVVQLNHEGKYAQALDIAKQALSLSEQTLGADHPETSLCLNNLALVFEALGDYAAALPLLERALAIREKSLGPDHPATATILNALAGIYQQQGKYSQALPLYQRALSIDEKALGPDHRETATSLGDIAELYRAQGNYAAALPMVQRALSIREKALGADDPQTATSLNNLALIYTAQGRYDDAQPLYRRVVSIMEKSLGPDHPVTADAISNLASQFKSQGNFPEALPLYRRALEIREKSLGPDHPIVATSLANLAVLYTAMGNYAEAIPLENRSLSIFEKACGTQHPDTARALSHLGDLYRLQGNFAEAKPAFQLALEIREKVLGPDHPETAITANNLASLYEANGDFKPALELRNRVLRIFEFTLGSNHPMTATAIGNLARLYIMQGDNDQAFPLYRQACEIMAGHLDRTASVQSENQQLATIEQSRGLLDAFVSCALLVGGEGRAVCQQLLDWKGAVTLHQRLARIAAHAMDNEENRKLWIQLEDVTGQLAALGRATPPPEKQAAWQSQIEELKQRKETIESQLSRQSADFLKLHSQSKLSVDQLSAMLPPDAALIDLIQFNRQVAERNSDGFVKGSLQRRLAASILRRDKDPVLVDLGLIDPINAALQSWRGNFGISSHDAQDEQPGQSLRRLIWEPLIQHLDNVKLALISPDGEISKLPWEALPGSKSDTYLIEELGIAVIPVPQLLPELLKPKQEHDQNTIPSMLLVGNVDYGASPGQRRTNDSLLASDVMRSALRTAGKTEFPPLPGTIKEVNLIDDIFQQKYPSGSAVRLEQGNATQQRFRDEAPLHQYLHLATHGFFVPAQLSGVGANFIPMQNRIVVGSVIPGGAADRDGRLKAGDQIIAVAPDNGQWISLDGKSVPETNALTRGPSGSKLRLKVQTANSGSVVDYELTRAPFVQQTLFVLDSATGVPATNNLPGLQCGIVLAGANSPRQAGQDDGIVTALEVASLDLQHVDVAVLSACETGLGQSGGGEGVFGLQRAFQVAGAKTTITSLWSVDDTATQTLMVEFYKRLWNKDHPLGKLEALRQAQLEMLHHYDPHAAKLVSQTRGLEQDEAPPESGTRLSPRYWAPFVLSGDWR